MKLEERSGFSWILITVETDNMLMKYVGTRLAYGQTIVIKEQTNNNLRLITVIASKIDISVTFLY